jgi:ABC-type Mn2+/Zn2+ transport system permease subunit
MGAIMTISSKFSLAPPGCTGKYVNTKINVVASGITTSIIIETILLQRGIDKLSWPMAARTAMGMSMVSMMAMEAAENVVDYHLTGGVVAIGDPQFWLVAALSITAGYLTPLPYNYLRLRKYGKACH